MLRANNKPPPWSYGSGRAGLVGPIRASSLPPARRRILLRNSYSQRKKCNAVRDTSTLGWLLNHIRCDLFMFGRAVASRFGCREEQDNEDDFSVSEETLRRCDALLDRGGSNCFS